MKYGPDYNPLGRGGERACALSEVALSIFQLGRDTGARGCVCHTRGVGVPVPLWSWVFINNINTSPLGFAGLAPAAGGMSWAPRRSATPTSDEEAASPGSCAALWGRWACRSSTYSTSHPLSLLTADARVDLFGLCMDVVDYHPAFPACAFSRPSITSDPTSFVPLCLRLLTNCSCASFCSSPGRLLQACRCRRGG